MAKNKTFELPPKGGKWKARVSKMPIGESFVVDCKEAAQSCQSAINRDGTNMRVQYRFDEEKGEYRIWRVQ